MYSYIRKKLLSYFVRKPIGVACTEGDATVISRMSYNQLSLEQSIARPLRLGSIVSWVFFLVFCTWAAFAPLSGAVVAAGQVSFGDSGKHFLQAVDGGQIKEILVKEGEHVSQGQVLLKLEDVDALATAQILKSSLFSLEVTAKRLRDELEERDYFEVPQHIIDFANHSSDLRDVISNQRRMFELRSAARRSKKELFEQNRITISKDIAGMSSQISEDRKRLSYMDEELSGLRDLVNQGYAPRNKLLELESRRSEIIKSINSYDTGLSKLQEDLLSIDIKLLNLGYETSQDIEHELLNVREKMMELTEKKKVADRNLARSVLVSPIAGVVNNMHSAFPGSVLRPGESIMEVVPPNEDLVVEAHLPRDHINAILGDLKDVHDYGKDGKLVEAKIRLPAYTGRWRHPLKAEVIYVAADVEASNNQGMMRAPGASYLIRLRISKEDLLSYPDIRLYPGMAAEVFVITGSRTMFSYLFEPILGVLRHSMSE